MENGKTYLSFAEMKKLLETAGKNHEEYVLIRVLSNGLAPRDVVLLRHKHFDFEKAKAEFEGKNGPRSVEIDLPTLGHINKLFKDRKVRSRSLEESSLFTWSEKYIGEIVSKVGSDAELGNNVTPTMLRNGWVFRAVALGRSLGEIHDQLGNQDLQHTTQIVMKMRDAQKGLQPKIMIYIPVHESKEPVLEQTLSAVQALDYDNYTTYLGVDSNSSPPFHTWLRKIAPKYGARVVHIGDIDAIESVEIEGRMFDVELESGATISRAKKARNKGLKIFRKTDAEYIIMCDADSAPKSWAIKKYLTLFREKRYKNVGIVSGLYFIRSSIKITEDNRAMAIPAVFFDPKKRPNADECYDMLFTKWKEIDSMEVDGVGMGFCMISRQVAEEVDFELPKKLENFMGEDYYYCVLARDKEYQTICICDVALDHLEDEKEGTGDGGHTPEQEAGEIANGLNIEIVNSVPPEYYDKEYFEDGLRRKRSGYIGYYNHPAFMAMANEIYHYFKPKRLLDVGTAKGFMVEEFVKLGVDAYGIDISEYAIKGAPESIQDRLVLGSSTDMPYHDKDFDLVITIDMMEHLNEEQYLKTIREMARVCSRTLIFSITTDDSVLDKSHISIKPIKEWIDIINGEIVDGFYRHTSNFLDQNILWFQPSMCQIFSRRRRKRTRK